MKDNEFADGIYWILDAINYKLGGGYDFSTGIDYTNDVFETQAFRAYFEDPCRCGVGPWEDVPHPQTSECGYTPGFCHFESGLEVNWYERVGRFTESNKSMKTLDWFKIVVECLESVRDD